MCDRRLALSAVKLGALNLAVALGFATLVRFKFLVWSVNDSNPPQCFNRDGGRISCRLEGATSTIFWVTVAGLFVLLAGIEVLVWLRRTTRSRPAQSPLSGA